MKPEKNKLSSKEQDNKLIQIKKSLKGPLDLLDVSEESIESRLSYKQKIFVIHYTRHGSATQACKDAGYSPEAARVTGHNLLQNPKVQMEILKRTQAIAMASAVTKEFVLVELAEIIEEMRASDFPDRNIQLKALDMIAKLSGFYQPDLMVNIQNNVDKINIQIIRPGEDESMFPSRIN